MRDFYDNDNPIKEVGRRSIFCRNKSFEKDDEYIFEKEMKEYERTVTSQKNNISNNTYNYSSNKSNSSNITHNPFVVIFCYILWVVFVIMVISLFEIANTSITPIQKKLPIESSLELSNRDFSDELDVPIYYILSSIKFDKVGSIIALYYVDTETKGNWCDFIEKDERFNGMVNTFQINYNQIPEASKRKLIKAWESRKFELVKEYFTGTVYARNTDTGYYLFVLLSDKDIIYGSGYGNYQDLFGE